MKLVSLNVARPRLTVYNGATINTGIFKKPVSGRVALRTLNLDGDQQADLSVHGGPNKAVYAYPSEHYDYWRRELPDAALPWGMFGENFTTEGLTEELHVGRPASNWFCYCNGPPAAHALLQAGGQVSTRRYDRAISPQRTQWALFLRGAGR